MADEKPNGRNSWHDLIDILSALMTRDNLVVSGLIVIVLYSIYMFGVSKSESAEKIILFVTGGLIGYLGGEIKKSTGGGQ